MKLKLDWKEIMRSMIAVLRKKNEYNEEIRTNKLNMYIMRYFILIFLHTWKKIQAILA